MGATSVTGVGQGSAEGSVRGSEHVTLAVGNLLGPKVVRCGQATLSGGAKIVRFGTLDGTTTDYAIFLYDLTDGSAVTYSSYTTAGFTLAGTGTHVINWMVVEIGLAGSTL